MAFEIVFWQLDADEETLDADDYAGYFFQDHVVFVCDSPLFWVEDAEDGWSEEDPIEEGEGRFCDVRMVKIW